jgi:hypothetical protein
LVGDQKVDARVFEDETQFVGFEKIVYGNGDAAGKKDAEESGDELGTILQPNADAMARLNSVFLLESRGGPLRLPQKIFVSEFIVTPIECRFCGVVFRGT